ncbi:hypothetical protein F511_37233 [Dorcoceras hygrometricum]|uniref:Dystroglycan-like n=1 Tax=Dorcoceras hygrometricum TaxID=472368 RepID=A0A2Z7BVD5_9LAMI|nr:hypothetical protein F511_37233 [Dorcoceras hygrometricum]
MASVYYSNTHNIDFESVLAMDDPGMVSIFQALKTSGLEGFLGCPAVIYEAALVDFFENSVRDGVLISTVAGQLVEISEEWFAESFDLPVDGLADLSEIPKDVVFDARSIVSMSGEPVSLSGKKSQMKVEYRLLCDIMAKSISVKAGSFNAITVEKFSMVTAVVCRVRMNWARVLFNILKKMVTPGSKQAKGFAVQISLLLENIPNLELGESSEFPASKILTEKTVHRYVSLNDKVGAEEATGALKPKAASKKRPAVVLGDEPVVKKKRTMKKKSSSSKPQGTVVEETVVDAKETQGPTEERHWFDLPYDDLIAKWDAERPVVTASDTDEDVESMDVGAAGGDQQVQFSEEEPEDVEMSVDKRSVDELIDADEKMSLEYILMTIPVDVPLPFAGLEITKITMGKEIKIPGVDEDSVSGQSSSNPC